MLKDVKVKNLGSMIIIICQSDKAKDWWTENVLDQESFAEEMARLVVDGGNVYDHQAGFNILAKMSLEEMTLDWI